MRILQKGFNYSQDGPGNRLVYHLQGCNFACKWCSNADSIPLCNDKAKDIFINILETENVDWVKQMLAIQGLRKYSDDKTEKVIKLKITDRNWYVRLNALEYLFANGLDNERIAEIFETKDKYTLETLLYLFKNDEEKSALITKALEEIASSQKSEEKEGVTV